MGNSSCKDQPINRTTYHAVHRLRDVAQCSECFEDSDARVRIQEIHEPPPSYNDSVNQRNYSPSAPCDPHSPINHYGSHALYPNLHDSSLRNCYPSTASVPPMGSVSSLFPPSSDKPMEQNNPEKINITSPKGSELPDELIDINYLLNLSTKEKSHVVSQMILHKNSFVKLLKDPLEYPFMLILMKLVKKVCLSDILEKKIDILKFVCCSNFFHSLGDYISDLPTHEQDTAQEDRLFLVESVVPFLESVFLLIPQECNELRDLVIKTSLSVQGMEQYRGMEISDDTKMCVQKMVSKLQGNVKTNPKEKSLSDQEKLQKNNSSSSDSFKNVLQYPCDRKIENSSTEGSVIKDTQQAVVPKKGPLSSQGVLRKNRVKRDSVRHPSEFQSENKIKTLSTGEKNREDSPPDKVPYNGNENIQPARSDELISSIHEGSFQVVLKVLGAFKAKKVRGMHKSFFFIDKVYKKKNNQNGEFLFALAQYLTKQKYDASNILLLSSDEDDLQNILRIREKYKFVENISAKLLSDTGSWSCSIILMSLSVNSSLGTIKYIVDIFRKASLEAREGIFIIGNMVYLNKLSTIWSALNDYLQVNEFISSSISLCCSTHGAISIVNEVQDFKTHRNGGCEKDCNMKLGCGHYCVRRCHTDDKKHRKYFCHKPCTRKPKNCTRNHSCSKFCFEVCGPCPCSVDFSGENISNTTLPPTYTTNVHVGDQNSKNEDIQNAIGEVIEKKNSSRHPKTNKSRMDNRLLPCGHTATVFPPPFMKLDKWSPELVNLCQEPCSASLECGHTCTGTCGKCRQGRIHISCQNRRKIRLACGHRIFVECRVNIANCYQKCFYQCPHSSCQKKCGELCTPCQKPCIRGCEHGRCTRRCSERCNWQPCSKPCEKLLSCGHKCVGYCGEPCPAGPENCRICSAEKFKRLDFSGKARFVVLEDCNHVVKGFELDQRMFAEHRKIEVMSCPICGYSINKTSRYLDYNREIYHCLALIRHDYKKYCNELPDKFWNIVEEVRQFSLPREIECSKQVEQMKEYTRLAASSSCIDEKSLILVQLVRNALCTLGVAPYRPSYWILTLLLYHYENGFSTQVLKELYRLVIDQQTSNKNLNKKKLLDLHLAISFFHMLEKDTWVRCPKGHVSTYGSLITLCNQCD